MKLGIKIAAAGLLALFGTGCVDYNARLCSDAKAEGAKTVVHHADHTEQRVYTAAAVEAALVLTHDQHTKAPKFNQVYVRLISTGQWKVTSFLYTAEGHQIRYTATVFQSGYQTLVTDVH